MSDRINTVFIVLAIVLMVVVILLASVQLFGLLGDGVSTSAWDGNGVLQQVAIMRSLIGGG